ncbi:hypothetical protein [Legionella drancourtii]|uniref:Uncharacterized protein n=1 Tax=Legionella drancourtii LLAP12 TaxID=658187 RepID=G9EKP8_9GAMM|nr:hypothetical protein [Legionella drancourtii]EHL32181.1 hypothetical protein LDG_5786 [Legionella drancourtii LLAP12]
MPGTACSIMEETLLKYPELRAFINSEPPNISLLKEALAYHYRLSEALFGQKMTVFQVCSYFNKVSHLQALSYNEETVKANYYKSIDSLLIMAIPKPLSIWNPILQKRNEKRR